MISLQIDSSLLSNQREILAELDRIQKNLPDPFSALWVKIIFLVIGALLGFGLARLYDWTRKQKLKKEYNKMYERYEGIYLAYEKYDREQKVIACIKLNRNLNIFLIEDGISVGGNEDFSGRIVMNQYHGNGYYRHKLDPNNLIRFGFYEIQLVIEEETTEILVHQTIFFKTKDEPMGHQVSEAYRWVKQSYSEGERLYEKFKEEQISNHAKRFNGK